MLYAALAYFVMPFDVIPDFVAGLGFTDDAAVMAMAIGLVARHITPEHIASEPVRRSAFRRSKKL